MRQRKIRNLDGKLEALVNFQIQEPEALKGSWKKPCYLEIGCGKGQFITKLAELNRDWKLVAFEGHKSVALHAIEKIRAAGHENVSFVLKYINSLEDVFEDGEISGIFLNFSDPWPKARHEKRRLTCGNRLEEYGRVLSTNGFLEFKTDNDGLFEYTLTEIANRETFVMVEMTRDLHNDYDKEKIITTEYEDKFSQKGKKINYLKLVKKR